LDAIAPKLEEGPHRAGETIFEKGDLGDSMYLVAEGQVRIHDGGRTLNHLYAGGVFGEMAVLDAEPRMASVTAVVNTQPLCLAQEPLYEAIEDRSEVGRGIIRVLSQHLRDITLDLGRADARLEALEGST
jgi:CRP-like cAMP-binding protein